MIKMTISTIILNCQNCKEHMGSLDIDDIFLVSAQEVGTISCDK